MPPIAISLLSGGLDSTTALWKVKNSYSKIYTLTFTYGTKDENVSIEVAKKLSNIAGAQHKIISLPWLGEFSKKSKSTLVTQKKVPQPRKNDLENSKKATETARSVWVPARNLVFLSIAISFAESLKGADIITGFDREEALTFPDNSRDFVNRMNSVVELAVLEKQIRIVTPLIEMNKKDIARLSIDLGVPTEYTVSCYEPTGLDDLKRPIHCGTCESCLRRKRGFKNLGEEQNTIYQGISSQKSQV